MFTHPEAQRWATLMLKSAMCEGMPPEEIARQVHLMCDRHGAECLEELIEVLLVEARRIGSSHSCGEYYQH